MSGTRIHRSPFEKDQFVKKTSRVKKEKGILASVRKEMDKPRLTESVRQALSDRAQLAVETPALGVHNR
jgi:hypothetical protein